MEEPTSTDDAAPAATTPAGRPRRRALRWVLAAAALVLVVGGLAALQLTAWQRFDQESTALRRALDRQDGASRDLQTALSGARSTSDAAAAVLAVQDPGLLTADERTALGAAGEQAATQAKAAAALLPGGRPRIGDREF